MERVSFIIAIQNKQAKTVLNNIKELSFWSADENDAPTFQDEIRWTKPNGDILRFFCIKIVDDISIPNKQGTYDVFQIIPRFIQTPTGIKKDWTLGTQLFRRIAKFSVPGIIGPWTAKKLEQIFPNFTNKYLKEQEPNTIDSKTGEVLTWKPKADAQLRFPVSISGIKAEDLAKVEYDPTQEEIDKDIEVNKEILFFKEMTEKLEVIRRK